MSHKAPAWIVERARDFLGSIDLDPCADPDNSARARRYLIDLDGPLSDKREVLEAWAGARTIFCAAPWSRFWAWVDRCAEHAAHAEAILVAPGVYVDGLKARATAVVTVPRFALAYWGSRPVDFAARFGQQASSAAL